VELAESYKAIAVIQSALIRSHTLKNGVGVGLVGDWSGAVSWNRSRFGDVGCQMD